MKIHYYALRIIRAVKPRKKVRLALFSAGCENHWKKNDRTCCECVLRRASHSERTRRTKFCERPTGWCDADSSSTETGGGSSGTGGERPPTRQSTADAQRDAPTKRAPS